MEIQLECSACGQELEITKERVVLGDLRLLIDPCVKCLKDADEAYADGKEEGRAEAEEQHESSSNKPDPNAS